MRAGKYRKEKRKKERDKKLRAVKKENRIAASVRPGWASAMY